MDTDLLVRTCLNCDWLIPVHSCTRGLYPPSPLSLAVFLSLLPPSPRYTSTSVLFSASARIQPCGAIPLRREDVEVTSLDDQATGTVCSNEPSSYTSVGCNQRRHRSGHSHAGQRNSWEALRIFPPNLLEYDSPHKRASLHQTRDVLEWLSLAEHLGQKTRTRREVAKRWTPPTFSHPTELTHSVMKAFACFWQSQSLANPPAMSPADSRAPEGDCTRAPPFAVSLESWAAVSRRLRGEESPSWWKTKAAQFSQANMLRRRESVWYVTVDTFARWSSPGARLYCWGLVRRALMVLTPPPGLYRMAAWSRDQTQRMKPGASWSRAEDPTRGLIAYRQARNGLGKSQCFIQSFFGTVHYFSCSLG